MSKIKAEVEVIRVAERYGIDLSGVKAADTRMIREHDLLVHLAARKFDAETLAARKVAASVRQPETQPSRGPWAASGEDPATWALRTGRITARSAPQWRRDLASNRQDAEAWLAQLYPILGSEGEQLAASAQFTRRSVPPDAPPGAYAVNPALAELPAPILASATADGGQPAPTLFESGDVPPVTASGMDPTELLRLPWQARLVVAAEGDRARALELFEGYVNNPDGAAVDFADDRRVLDYQRRVQVWGADNASPDALYAATYGDEALAEVKQAESADHEYRRQTAAARLRAIEDETLRPPR